MWAKRLASKRILYSSLHSQQANTLRLARCSFATTKWVKNDTFMQGNATTYIDQMYEEWQKNPDSVHASWRNYFNNLEKNLSPSKAYQPPPNLVPSSADLSSYPLPGNAAPSTEVLDHLKVQLLVRAFQVRGHTLADIDPLGLHHKKLDPATFPELDYKYYGFSDSDLEKKFTLGVGILNQFSKSKTSTTLRELIADLKSVYCTCHLLFFVGDECR
jgi:2-oxoglutarate dehydrogenase E1 component